MRGSRGAGGPDPHPYPLKNHTNLGFLRNTGPDPLKNQKATKPEFNVGPLAKCHFNQPPKVCSFLVSSNVQRDFRFRCLVFDGHSQFHGPTLSQGSLVQNELKNQDKSMWMLNISSSPHFVPDYRS